MRCAVHRRPRDHLQSGLLGRRTPRSRPRRRGRPGRGHDRQRRLPREQMHGFISLLGAGRRRRHHDLSGTIFGSRCYRPASPVGFASAGEDRDEVRRARPAPGRRRRRSAGQHEQRRPAATHEPVRLPCGRRRLGRLPRRASRALPGCAAHVGEPAPPRRRLRRARHRAPRVRAAERERRRAAVRAARRPARAPRPTPRRARRARRGRSRSGGATPTASSRTRTGRPPSRRRLAELRAGAIEDLAELPPRDRRVDARRSRPSEPLIDARAVPRSTTRHS